MFMETSTFKMVCQLSELADLSIELAQHLQQKAAEAEEAQAKVQLAGAFAIAAREVRLTVALEVKLIRQARGRDAVRRPRLSDERDALTPLPNPVKH